MNKRTLIVTVMASAIVVTIGGTALAKGPESLTITGPGIDKPIEVDFAQTGLIRDLFAQTGLWVGTSDGSQLTAQPTGDLGPAYTLTWVNSGPPSDSIELRTIRQVLYPLAEGGPVVETPVQTGLEGWGAGVIGWFRAPEGLADTLTSLGVPVPAPRSNEAPTSNEATAETSTVSDPVPTTESILDTSASTNPGAAVVTESEPAGGVRYVAFAVFGLLLALIWTARHRGTNYQE